MASIFTKIIDGDIPCHKIAESDKFLAFLDINPLIMGHILVVPKIEVDYIFDLEDDLLANMIVFSKNIAIVLKRAVPCKRIGVAIIGLEVPHAHIHLVPLDKMSDIDFTKTKLNPSHQELASTATTIRSFLD